MNIKCLPLGAYQTNCYLVWGENSQTCVVIDPGYEGDFVLEQVNKLGLTVEAVFLTHGHFDHVGGVETIVSKTGCALWMQEADWSVAPGYGIRQLFPMANCRFSPVDFYEHGEVVHAAGLDFTVWQTPGHTWGCVCLQVENNLFTGDTLFAGSIGRTDFPQSDWKTMAKSLEFLRSVTEDYTIFPGHGESSTLSAEQKTNPFLKV